MFWYALWMQVCPKKGINMINPTILLWGWDWGHQTYSREGYGSLGMVSCFSIGKAWCTGQFLGHVFRSFSNLFQQIHQPTKNVAKVVPPKNNSPPKNKKCFMFFSNLIAVVTFRPWRVEFPFHFPQGTCWRSSIVDCWQWEGRACNPAIHPLFFRHLVERKDSLANFVAKKNKTKTVSQRPLGSMGLYGIFSYMKGWLIFCKYR